MGDATAEADPWSPENMKNQIKDQIKQAAEQEDYQLAADLKRQLTEIEQQEKDELEAQAAAKAVAEAATVEAAAVAAAVADAAASALSEDAQPKQDGFSILEKVGEHILANAGTITLGEGHSIADTQVARDLARDQFVLEGNPVAGADIEAAVAAFSEELGCSDEMKQAIMQSLARTNSGGDAYCALQRMVREWLAQDAFATPAEAQAVPIVITREEMHIEIKVPRC